MRNSIILVSIIILSGSYSQAQTSGNACIGSKICEARITEGLSRYGITGGEEFGISERYKNTWILSNTISGNNTFILFGDDRFCKIGSTDSYLIHQKAVVSLTKAMAKTVANKCSYHSSRTLNIVMAADDCGATYISSADGKKTLFSPLAAKRNIQKMDEINKDIYEIKNILGLTASHVYARSSDNTSLVVYSLDGNSATFSLTDIENSFQKKSDSFKKTFFPYGQPPTGEKNIMNYIHNGICDKAGAREPVFDF